jgi:putative GTP pyrophosphokinase
VLSDEPSYSKREVSRAGQRLAARLVERRTRPLGGLAETDAEDARAREIIEWWRAQHVAPMLDVYETVKALAPLLEVGDAQLTAVSFRPKRVESMVEKLTREPGKLADMVDIGGVRAVANKQLDVDRLQARLADALDIRRVRDWARNPRSTGYRAVHLHVTQGARMIEVQLRTFGQDAWANAVEEETRVSGANYKIGQGDERVLAFFRTLGDVFGAVELGERHEDLSARFLTAYRQARPHLRLPTLRELEP